MTRNAETLAIKALDELREAETRALQSFWGKMYELVHGGLEIEALAKLTGVSETLFRNSVARFGVAENIANSLGRRVRVAIAIRRVGEHDWPVNLADAMNPTTERRRVAVGDSAIVGETVELLVSDWYGRPPSVQLDSPGAETIYFTEGVYNYWFSGRRADKHQAGLHDFA